MVAYEKNQKMFPMSGYTGRKSVGNKNTMIHTLDFGL